MQTVVVPHDVSSFQVICAECLALAGRDGAKARLVAGSLEPGASRVVAHCTAGHAVEAVRLDEAAGARHAA